MEFFSYLKHCYLQDEEECELMLQEIQAVMKTSKERKGKRVESPTHCNGSTGSVCVNKSTKRNSVQGRKATSRASDLDSTFFLVKLPFRVSFYSLHCKNPIQFK